MNSNIECPLERVKTKNLNIILQFKQVYEVETHEETDMYCLPTTHRPWIRKIRTVCM